MSTFNEGWYLIYTRPRHEKKVADGMAEVGVTSFLPRIKQLRNWSDRRKYIDMPLFPSYIFVFLKDMTDYYHASGTDGVLYFVKFDKKIARVQDSIINNLRLLVEQGADVQVTTELFQPGQQLVISDGPLTGLSCEVVQVNGKEKVLVRVHLLQRNVLATLPVKFVRPAQSNSINLSPAHGGNHYAWSSL